MTSLMEVDSWWIISGAVVSLICNSLAFWAAVAHQKKKTELILEESQRALRSRLRQLEEALESSQQDQVERWSEVRKTIARLEFRNGGSAEKIQRSATVGLDKKQQVLSLSRQGFGAEEISRKLNLYRGEIELVLGLGKYADARRNDARTILQ